VKNNDTTIFTAEEEKLLRKEQKRLKRSKRSRSRRAVDRIFGFLLATLILGLCAGLGLEYVLIKGPSPALGEAFSTTMFETRRFRWIPGIFLTQEEIGEIMSKRSQRSDAVFDPALITIATPAPALEAEGEDGTVSNPYNDYDEDGDGIILENITGNGYVGYMIKVLDPRRVFVARGGGAYPLAEICQSNGCLGGINAGAFVDENGGGNGSIPEGLTIIDGEVQTGGFDYNQFVGLTAEGYLAVSWMTVNDAINSGIVGGVTFGPILIQNNQPTDFSRNSGSLNPRTAIGQRADGCILMLVIDGRQVHSYGANYQDLQDIMLEYGAVNAINLDGGSSTTMWYNGSYVNSCSSANGIARPIPNAFVFR